MKNNPTVEVRRGDMQTARERWCKFYGLDVFHHSFAHYLGVTHLNTIKSHRLGIMMLRKSAADKIMMLNSPHWYALLKAREAKRLKP